MKTLKRSEVFNDNLHWLLTKNAAVNYLPWFIEESFYWIIGVIDLSLCLLKFRLLLVDINFLDKPVDQTFNGRKNREKNLEDTIRNMNGTREIDVHYKFISWRCRNAKLKMKRKLKRWNMGLRLRLGFHIYGPRHNLVLNLLLLYWTTSEVEFAIEIVKSLHNAYIEKATLFDQHESGESNLNHFMHEVKRLNRKKTNSDLSQDFTSYRPLLDTSVSISVRPLPYISDPHALTYMSICPLSLHANINEIVTHIIDTYYYLHYSNCDTLLCDAEARWWSSTRRSRLREETCLVKCPRLTGSACVDRR